jgi:mitosis inhibitor protein kinase SWE1
VATPNGSSQLWLGAFNSTGLISKVNRNFEEEADKKMVPPDTPCKKHSNPFATYPPKFNSILKKENNRKSFGGIPSTPFSSTPSQAPDTFGKPGKGLAIFQRGTALRNSRRGSILGLEEEDRKLLGEPSDSGAIGDGDVPPTPTRNTLTPSGSNLSQQSLESPSANRTQAPMSAVRPPISRESTSKSTQTYTELRADAMGEVSIGDIKSESNRLSLPSASSKLPPLSFGMSRATQGWHFPPPLLSITSFVDSSRKTDAKMNVANLASPVDGRRTPQTPQEGYLPWDTSRLSISRTANGDDSMPPPMTPTGARDLRSSTSIFVTPANVRTQNLDIDSSLTGRFDKVEYIGKGEFSSVFRVSLTNHRQNALDALSGAPQLDMSHSPARGSIFAVKKSRHPFQGPKDREAKLREVKILQALTHAEHVVHYVDSWEHNYHLYIQTEFCEEGTLDKFLGNVGRGGRLDDFRIFKMLQDLCLVGLIHPCLPHISCLHCVTGPQGNSRCWIYAPGYEARQHSHHL